MEKEAPKKTEKRAKKPGSFAYRAAAGIILLFLGILIFSVVRYFVSVVGYKGYRQYIKEYGYESGSVYAPIREDELPGYDLVAESEFLKLYTRTEDARIAVQDKRSGFITYSNPGDPDADSVANEANKNILRSQFLLYYYNDDVVSGMLNSYTDCVAKGACGAESIRDGVRYLYTVGDDTASFVIPLEYRLMDDHLEVTIPSAGIRELGGGYLYRIQLLRYMGAAGPEDEGYIVVPNGSGSLIYFNNGKTNAPMYSQYVYDIDPLAASHSSVESQQSVRLPIYGICSQDADILVSIEGGATACVISAEVSGAYNDRNFAFPSFVYRTADDLKDFGDSDTSVLVMEKEMYRDDVRVRYSFLDEGHRGYSGIAAYYRERLEREGVIERVLQEENIPFYCDVITGVRETGHFLGVRYLHSFPMTTFSEAGEMSARLWEAGVENQVMNLQGWFNGGYYHDAADHVDVSGSLGGRRGLESLNEAVTENGGRLYADVAFQKVSCADRFFPYLQLASRYYGSGHTALFGQVDPTTYRNTASYGYPENRFYVLSPKFLPRYVGSFTEKTKDLGIGGFCLRDLGNYLASDKRRTEEISREQAMNIVCAQIQRIRESGKELMISEANAYSFAWASDIINAPLDHTPYEIVDERIPLYEMILHGYIPYSTQLLNFENRDDMEMLRLRMIESGASPHYVFTQKESGRMKLTAMNVFYSTSFENWEESAAETYHYVNEALSPVQSAAVTEHEIVNDHLRRVTYDNGITILINYGDTQELCDGITVPAKGYVLCGENAGSSK